MLKNNHINPYFCGVPRHQKWPLIGVFRAISKLEEIESLNFTKYFFLEDTCTKPFKLLVLNSEKFVVLHRYFPKPELEQTSQN